VAPAGQAGTDQASAARAGRGQRRDVVLLGSTGSIGTQTIEVVTRAPDRFRVSAIAAGGGNPRVLAEQAAQLRVAAIGISHEHAVDVLREELAACWPGDQPYPRLYAGPHATEELAQRGCDVVLNAVAGAQGLRATLAALDAGRVVALANKESLIAGGPLVTARARPGQLVPVDSEHSALAQCLRSGRATEVRRLLVTASGGPFRGKRRDELGDVTPEQALAHPTWNMGRLVTTNSATLVNKGLEVIEAHLLFDIPLDRIDVVVHPQSVIHSMVEFVDGSTIAQASPPDMRLPISLALGWPDRVPHAAAAVDWTHANTWTFEPLDPAAFPAVELAREAGAASGCAPAVYNAANEELVDAFHAGAIKFLQIVDTLAAVLHTWLSEHHERAENAGNPGTVEDVEGAESWARERARAVAAAPTPSS
jgi:1-deoxy-D-xylulose-5-phosphate reductoisomerase